MQKLNECVGIIFFFFPKKCCLAIYQAVLRPGYCSYTQVLAGGCPCLAAHG